MEEKPLVLVVDDDKKIVELIKTNLELSGLDVITAYDGEEALSKLSVPGRVPEMVILDIVMPKLSGYEVAKKIRETPGLKDILVIMVSAKNEPLDKIEGLIVSDADYYLSKPFDINDLLILTLKSLARIVSKQKASAIEAK